MIQPIIQIWVYRYGGFLFLGGDGGEAPITKRGRGGGVGGAFPQAAPRANDALERHLRAATSFDEIAFVFVLRRPSDARRKPQENWL